MGPTRSTAVNSDVHGARATMAAWSAVVALVALVVGGVGMSVTALPGRPVEAIVEAARSAPALPALAALALACVSLADLGTIAALHDHLHRHGHRLVLLAAGTAIVGDLLNIAGRLAQLALVPIAQSDRTDLAASAAVATEALNDTFNTAGFVLVAIAFGAFGVLFFRQGHRLLAAVGVVAAIGTAVGQIPALVPAFYVADIAFLVWYIALARLFFRVGSDRAASVSADLERAGSALDDPEPSGGEPAGGERRAAGDGGAIRARSAGGDPS